MEVRARRLGLHPLRLTLHSQRHAFHSQRHALAWKPLDLDLLLHDLQRLRLEPGRLARTLE
ncbi:MAG TPA: hypothetical protein VE078_01000 [Thermoanaerobaculia bacterium]|nr:hypothetical protein [Thermoanaerobaculia bacterium]